MDAYHGKWAFMPSSVLELLPNFKSTYFASLNPPIVHVYCTLIRSILEYAPAVFADLPKYLACYLENVQKRVLSNPVIWPGILYETALAKAAISTLSDHRAVSCI